MQALVPPPCSMGLDYTQSLQRRTAELEAELAQAEKSLEAKDEELAKLQGKADILQDEVLKRGMQIRNLDERWCEMTHEVNDLHIEVERLSFALKDKDEELESVRDEHRTQIDELMTEIERLMRKNKKRIELDALKELVDRHDGAIDRLWGRIHDIEQNRRNT